MHQKLIQRVVDLHPRETAEWIEALEQVIDEEGPVRAAYLLEQLTDRILAAHVVLLHDETSTRKHIVKVHLAVPGPDIYAEDAEDDLYAAIDKVTGKLSQQLRKRKTRIADRKPVVAGT